MNKNSFLGKINNQNGQALLIVVLVMVVALTVGLSIASKSITSFRNSTEQASSQKALSAAEAGIEQALKSNTSISSSFPQDTKYDAVVSIVQGKTFLLNGGNPVLQNSGIDLWLTTYSKNPAELYKNPYPSSESFTVYWGDSSGGCNNAALEVVVIAGTRASPVISTYAFDPCEDRSNKNSLEFINLIKADMAGRTFYYQATIPVGNGGVPGGGGLIARVVPLYTSAIMAVNSIITPFPPQGSAITSVGKSGTTERKVNVFQGYPALPAEYFLYNLFVP